MGLYEGPIFTLAKGGLLFFCPRTGAKNMLAQKERVGDSSGGEKRDA
ncbi:MAG: hypothetical protein ACREAY_00580 [Nitrososphaera sp.]